jgi:hypothetical protein
MSETVGLADYEMLERVPGKESTTGSVQLEVGRPRAGLRLRFGHLGFGVLVERQSHRACFQLHDDLRSEYGQCGALDGLKVFLGYPPPVKIAGRNESHFLIDRVPEVQRRQPGLPGYG